MYAGWTTHMYSTQCKVYSVTQTVQFLFKYNFIHMNTEIQCRTCSNKNKRTCTHCHTPTQTDTHIYPPVRPRSPYITLFISSLIPFAEMMSWKHERNPVNWGETHSNHSISLSVLLSLLLTLCLFVSRPYTAASSLTESVPSSLTRLFFLCQ